MPSVVALAPDHRDLVGSYRTAKAAAGQSTGHSTLQAARSFCAKLERAGGWEQMSRAARFDAIDKARSFASWLMVTGRLRVDADIFGRVSLRLGTIAQHFCPDAHGWFLELCQRLRLGDRDITIQWNALAMITAVTGVLPDQVGDREFELARDAVVNAYVAREKPESGRNMASVFHRLRLTLFHGGRLDSHRHPSPRLPVSVSGWAVVAPAFAESARRYVAQVQLSLRPSTVHHIEHDLREFGTWLAAHCSEVRSCADLERGHIEAYKTWLATTVRPRTGKPLNRVSIKDALINLHCFFDRITDWGYPGAPQRPLIFVGDLPIIDKPLPRFLDDAAAAKLLRAARRDEDPLARLVTELLARTGIRRGELHDLTVDAVVQIGSAYWLRIPVGKLHNDRYIPLHPQLKELLDDWVANHRPTGVRSDRLLIDRNRPITYHRVAKILRQQAKAAGIGHVTAHRLRHTLATQAINRGMSLDAIAALLGHKTLAMTMVYARIADRTVADQYFAVTEKVEALYDQPRQLPAGDEGSEMRKLRAEMGRRMLGNGYCARPVEMDCHFESICESCTYFVTTVEFRPTLRAQRDDAEAKGQVGRVKVFDGLLSRLDTEAS
jgi:integrase/recombinase XerD